MMAATLPPELLLVDDEEDILKAVSAYLEMELDDVRVLVAPNAKEGLEILDHGDIALVVSDFRMPGMDGLEFLVEVHRRCPDVPTIMMTAYADEHVERSARQDAGVHLFLPKPLDLDSFVAAIKEAVEGLRCKDRPTRRRASPRPDPDARKSP
jgi:DNA-binding NtrC family response regulator